jgi:hypothetical protein
MRALSEHDLVDSSAWATLKLTNREGTTTGRRVPSGVHVQLAVVGGRNAAARITGSMFQIFVATSWAGRARSRDIELKGSNTPNLELDLSWVNAIRERCPVDYPSGRIGRTTLQNGSASIMKLSGFWHGGRKVQPNKIEARFAS